MTERSEQDFTALITFADTQGPWTADEVLGYLRRSLEHPTPPGLTIEVSAVYLDGVDDV